MSAENLKKALLLECTQSKYGAKDTDRSGWQIAYAKRDIKQRGVVCLLKGDPVLFDPTSVDKQRNRVTVYLAKNIGGMNTSRYAHEFDLGGSK